MVDFPKKILIIRLSSIGDILLTTPIIRQIKKSLPQTRLDFIVKNEFKDLLVHNPYINNLYTLNLNNDQNSLKRAKGRIQKNAYDIIFDLHNNIRSNFLRRGSGARFVRKIHKNKLEQILLVYLHINAYKKITPIPQRYLNVAKDFGVEDDGKGLEIYWHQDTIDSVNQKTGLKGMNNLVCLAPGAAHFTKRWPETHFKSLCNRILKLTENHIIILGGDSDKELGKYLSENDRIFDFTGKLSLLESANILSRAKALVTNDTGLMHLGTAVNIPVISLFGSTVEAFGFFPYRGKTKVLEVTNLPCRPCTHIGRASCPRKHFKCMNDIKPEEVFDNLENILRD